jgi:4-alpha-glucanotransferase
LNERELRSLRRLARLYGIQPSYLDDRFRRIDASPETLLSVLRSLGAPLSGRLDFDAAAGERLIEHWRWCIEPVHVAWDGLLPAIELRLPAADASGRIEWRLALEGGGVEEGAVALDALQTGRHREIAGEGFVAKRLDLTKTLPLGYHRLTLSTGPRRLESLVIAAPERGHAREERDWGLFLPLYALRTADDWGTGSYPDLGRLSALAGERGAGLIGTLPLLAAFLDTPCEPSPYRPLSRLFWSELFIDVEAAAREAGCAAASELLASSELRSRIAALRDSELVPFREAMAAKRAVLEALSAGVGGSSAAAEFERYLRSHPQVEDYARFRAVYEAWHEPWQRWPERERGGDLREAAPDQAVARYYAYAQWLAETQLAGVTRSTGAEGPGIYLDLPVGVHPDGYDAWRYQSLFVPDTDVGAPPDIVTTSGQSWGFAPLDPRKTREGGYEYQIAYLRHQMRVAGLLRVDHVMGLHRLYYVPHGASAGEGVYVRYPYDELYALLCLESQREGCEVLGENLGIVPDAVTREQARHAMSGMYVLSVYLRDDPQQPYRPIAENSVASFGTHDLPTFAAFWQDLDFERREQLGVLDRAGGIAERAARERQKQLLIDYWLREGFLDPKEADDLPALLRACLAMLASSPARRVLVNLEDVWLETEPQNVPGTTLDQYSSWHRRARHTLDEAAELSTLTAIAEAINQRLKR